MMDYFNKRVAEGDTFQPHDFNHNCAYFICYWYWPVHCSGYVYFIHKSVLYFFSQYIISFGLKLNYWINLCLALHQLQCLPKKSKFKRNIIFESIFWETIGGCNNRDQSWYRVPSQSHNIFYYLLTANQFWCSHSISMKNFKFKPKTLSKLDIYIKKIAGVFIRH